MVPPAGESTPLDSYPGRKQATGVNLVAPVGVAPVGASQVCRVVWRSVSQSRPAHKKGAARKVLPWAVVAHRVWGIGRPREPDSDSSYISYHVTARGLAVIVPGKYALLWTDVAECRWSRLRRDEAHGMKFGTGSPLPRQTTYPASSEFWQVSRRCPPTATGLLKPGKGQAPEACGRVEWRQE